MCGIGGVWGRVGVATPARLGVLFSDALAHRGPDGEGFLAISDEVAPRTCEREALARIPSLRGLFVHRRLSIIDLTTGDQPMSLHGDDPWIVFNGEIYNYPDVKAELSRLESEPFHTTSDTEVILRVYRRWGVDGLRRLNGMFALAIYDHARRRVVIARDPVGVKPLYWVAREGVAAFASEIRPLIGAGLARREVSAEAVAQFLFYRFVAAPHSLWSDVHKVRPGHALVFSGDGDLLQEVDFAAPAPTPRAGQDPSVSLAPQLTTAIQRQMISDVPVGAFLSGGLDSSIVVRAMTERVPGVETFAIGFPDEPGIPSELHAARRAAEILASRHQELAVSPEGYFGRLPQAIAQVEEPVAHPGMLLQSDLAALARRYVKVVLTGQGADEPLGGYPRHQAARVLPLLAGLAGGIARSAWMARATAGRERAARIRRVLAAPAGPERAAALFSPLDPGEVGGLVRGCGPAAGREAVLGAIGPWWQRGAGLDDVARVLYVDVRTSLAEDLLLVGDKMAMQHSLEARVPYLDLEYLAAVESLPGATRVHVWGDRKRIQRAIGKRVLPTRLYETLAASTGSFRRKRGFDVPVNEWLHGVGAGGLEEFVVGTGSILPDYVDVDRLRPLIRQFQRGSGRAFRTLLSLFVLEVWFRIQIGGESPNAVRSL